MRETYKTVQALFREDRTPDTPLLHAVLFRLCSREIGALRNCLRKRTWWQAAAEMRCSLETHESHGRAPWLAAIRDLLLERGPRRADKLLVACSVVLEVLDDHHRNRRNEIERRTFDLSAGLGRGSGKTVFLSPPARPIEELIPEPLVRGRGDLKNDLRTYLGLWWHLIALDEHPVTPICDEIDATVSAILTERIEAGAKDLTVGLASPFADLSFRIESDLGRCHPQDGTPYRFASIDDDHRRDAEAALEKIIAACDEHRVDVLCFPELTIDFDLLGHLSDLLQKTNEDDFPALVVAGSFHLQGDKCWQNRCSVLDGWGHTLFEQAKCVAFKLPPARARELGPKGMKRLGIDERGGYEDIDVGSQLRVVDTPLGRLVTPICLDYCGDELRDLLIESGVNLLLVPAMTPRMKPFHEQAKALGTRARAVSFVVNSAWYLRQAELSEEAAARELLMGYVPRRGGLYLSAEQPEPTSDLHLFKIRVLLE